MNTTQAGMLDGYMLKVAEPVPATQGFLGRTIGKMQKQISPYLAKGAPLSAGEMTELGIPEHLQDEYRVQAAEQLENDFWRRLSTPSGARTTATSLGGAALGAGLGALVGDGKGAVVGSVLGLIIGYLMETLGIGAPDVWKLLSGPKLRETLGKLPEDLQKKVVVGQQGQKARDYLDYAAANGLVVPVDKRDSLTNMIEQAEVQKSEIASRKAQAIGAAAAAEGGAPPASEAGEPAVVRTAASDAARTAAEEVARAQRMVDALNQNQYAPEAARATAAQNLEKAKQKLEAIQRAYATGMGRLPDYNEELGQTQTRDQALKVRDQYHDALSKYNLTQRGEPEPGLSGKIRDAAGALIPDLPSLGRFNPTEVTGVNPNLTLNLREDWPNLNYSGYPSSNTPMSDEEVYERALKAGAPWALAEAKDMEFKARIGAQNRPAEVAEFPVEEDIQVPTDFDPNAELAWEPEEEVWDRLKREERFNREYDLPGKIRAAKAMEPDMSKLPSIDPSRYWADLGGKGYDAVKKWTDSLRPSTEGGNLPPIREPEETVPAAAPSPAAAAPAPAAAPSPAAAAPAPTSRNLTMDPAAPVLTSSRQGSGARYAKALRTPVDTSKLSTQPLRFGPEWLDAFRKKITRSRSIDLPTEVQGMPDRQASVSALLNTPWWELSKTALGEQPGMQTALPEQQELDTAPPAVPETGADPAMSPMPQTPAMPAAPPPPPPEPSPKDHFDAKRESAKTENQIKLEQAKAEAKERTSKAEVAQVQAEAKAQLEAAKAERLQSEQEARAKQRDLQLKAQQQAQQQAQKAQQAQQQAQSGPPAPYPGAAPGASSPAVSKLPGAVPNASMPAGEWGAVPQGMPSPR